MSEAVLDASALLAVVHQENGADRVLEVIQEAAISSVNYAEVVSSLLDKGWSEQEVALDLQMYELDVQPFTESLAWLAGMLRPLTRDRGLSLGDRACLALGRALGLPVLTADRQWRGLDVGVEIQMIR